VSDPQKPIRRAAAGEFAGDRSASNAEQERSQQIGEQVGLRLPVAAPSRGGGPDLQPQAPAQQSRPGTAPAGHQPHVPIGAKRSGVSSQPAPRRQAQACTPGKPASTEAAASSARIAGWPWRRFWQNFTIKGGERCSSLPRNRWRSAAAASWPFRAATCTKGRNQQAEGEGGAHVSPPKVAQCRRVSIGSKSVDQAGNRSQGARHRSEWPPEGCYARSRNQACWIIAGQPAAAGFGRVGLEA